MGRVAVYLLCTFSILNSAIERFCQMSDLLQGTGDCLPIMVSARGCLWAPCGLFTNHGFSQRGRMSGCLWSTLWAVNNFNFVLAIQGITIKRHLETCLVKTMEHTCKMQYTIPLLMKTSAIFTSDGQQAQDCQSSKTLEYIQPVINRNKIEC